MPLTVRPFDSNDSRSWGEFAARRPASPAAGTSTYYAVSYPEYLEFISGNFDSDGKVAKGAAPKLVGLFP
jgi:hypothetical protein